jgi:GT2 family glycosyltransferase
VPEPRWLEEALGAFADGVGIVQGTTRAEPAASGYGVQFSRTMEVSDEDGHYPTCNIFYRREALERVGGFDESFRYACGEDTDLAWRVKAAGYDSRFCREAVVTHDVRPPSFRVFLRERRRFAEQILLVKRHPHLRRFYYRRYFYQRSHVHAIAALLLIAAVGSGLWSAAALLPVVWLDRFRHTRFAGGWGRRALVAGELLLADFWELLVFCYGSLRYRTLLI